MPIKPTDAKKMGQDFNTMDLKSMIQQNDEIMRMVMEAGDMEAAEEAAQHSAEAAAALIARKQGVRELANRVRQRVSEDDPAKPEQSAESAQATPATESAAATEPSATTENPENSPKPEAE